jgi:hypothetical protein
MAVADLAAEWCETDLLRATVAARGIHGSFAGPRSAGTSIGLLLQAALDGQAVAPSATFRGGMGALAQALAAAARAAGARIRTNAPVARIRVEQERAVAVLLSTGDEIRARAVVSNADPKSTFLKFMDPADDLTLSKGYATRSSGIVAEISYAVGARPRKAARKTACSGPDPHGPKIDYLERASMRQSGELAEPYWTLRFRRWPTPCWLRAVRGFSARAICLTDCDRVTGRAAARAGR